MPISHPTAHLLDELVATLGTFDVHSPRVGRARGMCLSFTKPMFEPRHAEIVDSMLRSADCDDIAVGLVFWRHARTLNPEQAFALLARHGVGAEDRWSIRTLPGADEDSRTCQFASQDIAVSPKVAHVLAEMVTRMDFGTWERLTALLYLWNRKSKVLVRYWDDRGADVLCQDSEALALQARHFAEHVDWELTASVWTR